MQKQSKFQRIWYIIVWYNINKRGQENFLVLRRGLKATLVSAFLTSIDSYFGQI